MEKKPANNSSQPSPKERSPKDRQFDHTDRDEGTTAIRHDLDADPGLAEEDQPKWQPPESIPEPRPADPIMKPTQQSSQKSSTNTNSPT